MGPIAEVGPQNSPDKLNQSRNGLQNAIHSTRLRLKARPSERRWDGAGFGRNYAEKQSQKFLAHFLAQEVAGYAQMMPFCPTNTAVNRSKHVEPTDDKTILSPLL